MNSSASSFDPKVFDEVSSASTRHKACKSLKGKMIIKKEIRKNVSLCPQATGGGFISIAVYQVNTSLDLDIMALLKS